MDLIYSALSAAIDAPAPTPALQTAYRALLDLLKTAPNADDLLDHVTQLQDDGGALWRQARVQQALSLSGLLNDARVVAAAKVILALVSQPQWAAQAGIERDLYPIGKLNYAVVPVWFATDRNATGAREPWRQFGSARGLLSYGRCDISIPRDHRMGELESRSLLRLEFRDNPARHVVLLSSSVLQHDAFFAGLAERVAQAPRQHAFVFVHGYNVSFEDAARRTGQMCYDLAFDGAAVFYSWPSQGELAGYIEDEANIEWSQANLLAFLTDFLARTTVQQVYLIGHSMGTRALARAVTALFARDPAAAARIREIILTAPDIDAAVFLRDIVPALSAAPHPVTLYASSEDRALAASKKIHGYVRAGESGSNMVLADRVETIDATGVDTSFIKHSYFAGTRSALSDMYYLINHDLRAAQRFGLQLAPGGRYWTFKS